MQQKKGILLAKEKVGEIAIMIDNLKKNQQSFSRDDFKNSSDTLIEETDETIAAVKCKSAEIMRGLEEHKKALLSKERFIRRHYSRK